MNQFDQKLKENQLDLKRASMQTLQINIGRLCNQACSHCHVEAGPKRKENMSARTLERVMELISQSSTIKCVDITGGAPELNPNFRQLVRFCREKEIRVIDRCNLTVLQIPGQEDTAEFLASQGVEITASLPCYSQKNVDQQRGRGVFLQSIEALKKLNDLGYGKAHSSLVLNLVYNPTGPFLPPEQSSLEKDYRERLWEDFGIEFTSLFTITNMPIKRFLRDLKRQNQLSNYMELLMNQFNSKTCSQVMCRDLISVGYDGQLYDCDFNQMLDLPLARKRQTLWEIDSFDQCVDQTIATGDHCFGCTAGAGSSCGGSLENTTS